MEKNQPETRWEALKEIIGDMKCRNAIAHAWPFYFYLIFQGDKSNKITTSYPEMARRLGVPLSTIKKWKERLIEQNIGTSVQGKHGWSITLAPPFDTPLTCLKSDYTEIVLKSDDPTKKLMKKMFSSDSLSLLPLIAELAHKVERMEQTTMK